ncbi:MAG: hypothetical protein ABIH37_01425 [archaeon]
MTNFSNKLKEPHNVAWLILLGLILGVVIFFDYFRDSFLKISLIGILFILFYFFDDVLFKPIGNSVKSICSGNLFVKRWKAFPIFLLEIYLIYFLSTLLEGWLETYLAPENLSRWYVLIWIGIMYLFYHYKGSRS